MKTKITIFLFTFLAIASCSKWHYGHGGHDDDDGGGDNVVFTDTNVDEAAGNANEKIVISPNEIIVKYQPEVSAARRAEIRDEYPIVSIQECDCGDTNIELWVFDPDIEELEIEGVVDRLSRTSPRGKTRGERSFTIELAPVGPFIGQGQGVDNDEQPLIANAGDAPVNIAIIDTGLDFYRYLNSETPARFLFPSGAFSDCFDTDSGWNFTADIDGDGSREGNGAINDSNGHGTYVTKIITDILDDEGINYQILPLKVFDFEGKGSYWDVLCALAYVKNINQNGGNINIVNASFGGKMPREVFQEPAAGDARNIFVETLDDLKNLGTLIVTSAGNKGKDNDIGPDGDFLSSFQSSNILTVGGYEYDSINPAARPIRIHPSSNFGSEGSTDIALAFNNYKIIYDTSNPFEKNRVTLQGTSYATAAMSGLAGTIIDRAGSISPEELKDLIFRLSVEAPELEGKIAERRVYIRAE